MLNKLRWFLIHVLLDWDIDAEYSSLNPEDKVNLGILWEDPGFNNSFRRFVEAAKAHIRRDNMTSQSLRDMDFYKGQYLMAEKMVSNLKKLHKEYKKNEELNQKG